MKTIIVALCIFLFTGFTALAQHIDSTLARYANEYAPERTYLQFDKNSYTPGETIWFKAYLMEGLYPGFGSKTFYTDWTDEDGNLLTHITGPVVGATSNGQFDIPTDYAGKFIHIKAYTRWMLNFDSAFLYEKDIRVFTKNSTASSLKNTILPTLTFFPEGGDAVAGITNKIAFKVNDQWGRPVNIKGVVINGQGKTVDSLRVMHDGMGYFFLIPQPGESFSAKWSVVNAPGKEEKGTAYSTPLPTIKSTGISLQVEVSGTKRNFRINAPPEVAAELGTIHLLGTINQAQAFLVTKDITGGNVQGVIPTEALPSGILTITVFDDHWTPLAERITYINNQDFRFYPEMSVQHWGLNKRARNEIEITVPDSLDANFSVAVTDAQIDRDSSDNIISHLLLTSDIKGRVYNPTYYFSDNNDLVSQHLDLVMLTHGWRRFKWDEVVKGKMPRIDYPKDTSYLSVSGKIYGPTPAQFKDGATILLIISQKKGDANKMSLLPVAPNGTFTDPSLVLFDTAHIYYKLSKGILDATVQFMENRLPARSSRTNANGFFYNQSGDTTGTGRHFELSDEMTRLLAQYEGKTLENVIVRAKTKSPLEKMDEKYTSALFQGDGYQFDLVDDKTAFATASIFTYLQAKVAGLIINTSNGTPSMTWRGGSPQLFLDEVPVDPDLVNGIAIKDIAYIKVFRPPFFGGSGSSANGAIAIYTRRGDDANDASGKGLDNNSVSGYSPIRQFYSPNYSSFLPANERRDTRTTLYWNPQVVTTPQKNKVTLVFYNNDVSRAFRVVIEGISKDGQLAHIEQIME